MALTESTMVNLGSKAPYFNLPNIDGKNLSIEDGAKLKIKAETY